MVCKDSNNWHCECCKNELNLDKLCAKKAIIHKLCVDDLNLKNELCAETLSGGSLCVNQAMAQKGDFDSICVSNLNSSNNCFQNVTATNMGVSNLVANDLCVPGQLKAANFLNCGKYRASVAFSVPQTYTLGNNLAFDSILDDPNSNISFSPTTYTVPVSGYYVLTLKVNVSNLQSSSGPILGSPVANPEVYLNGNLSREIFLPWLTFNNESKVLLTSLISLLAGDKVTMKYKVKALDAASGLIDVIGTVDIFGNGLEDGNSVFKISLLNVDCLPSEMCQPSVQCQPCSPMRCTPCIPSQNCGCNRECPGDRSY